MDWLMGKARGVGRGLMSTSMNLSNPTPVSEVTCAMSAANISPANNHDHVVTTPPTPLPTLVPSNSTGDLTSKCSSPVTVANSTTAVINNLTPTSLSSPGQSLANSPVTTQQPISVKTSFPSSSPDIPFLQEAYLNQLINLGNRNGDSLINFYDLVEPFPSMDLNEWLAVHTINLFENLSSIFDAIHELCDCTHLIPPNSSSALTSSSLQTTPCHSPTIITVDGSTLPSSVNLSLIGASSASSTAPLRYEEDKSKKSKSHASPPFQPGTRYAARQTIDFTLSFCHDLIQHPRVFPKRNDQLFPPDLHSYVAVICRNLLICLIHLYRAHFDHLDQLELIAHINTLSKHFFAFTKRFQLIDEKDYKPLLGLNKLLFQTITTTTGSSPSPSSSRDLDYESSDGGLPSGLSSSNQTYNLSSPLTGQIDYC